MNIRKIGDAMSMENRPDWLNHGHDHISKIPFTDSFAFYPYNIEEANEEYLNSLYNKHGYTVKRYSQAESEYNSMQHVTYKVLILEPNYDQEKIDAGCDLIREYYRDMWIRQNMDVGQK